MWRIITYFDGSDQVYYLSGTTDAPTWDWQVQRAVRYLDCDEAQCDAAVLARRLKRDVGVLRWWGPSLDK